MTYADILYEKLKSVKDGSMKAKLAEEKRTLRDEFAMAALTGLLAHDEYMKAEYAADDALRYADAMMKARSND